MITLSQINQSKINVTLIRKKETNENGNDLHLQIDVPFPEKVL